MRARALLLPALATILLLACWPGTSGPDAVPAVTMTRGEVAVPGATLPYVAPPVAAPCIVLGSSVYHERLFSERSKRFLGCAIADTRISAPGAAAPEGGYGVDALLADLDLVREHLGQERVLVIGHSIFGLLALEYARQYPSRASHVAAIAAPPWVGEGLDAVQATYWEQNASAERKALHKQNTSGLDDRLAALGPADALRERYLAGAARLWANPTYDASPLWDGVTINAELFEQLVDDLARRPRLSDGQPLRLPVFLALGRHDYVFPPTMWSDQQHVFHNLFVEQLAASGHAPPLEQPTEFDELLATWLSLAR